MTDAKTHGRPKSPWRPWPGGRQTLRVSVERLDKVMNLVGELVTAKIRLSQIACRCGR